MSVATPNMDQMVARLIKLSPPMLQEFAAEHQNDTYALLAAKAASEAQKKMMAAGRPQQMGMPPKVNEQVVASIAQPQAPQAAPQAQGLPEESGIAQLPAPNMQGMAGGGIVAFDEGGEVPGFAEGLYNRPVGYMPYAPYAPGVSKNNLLPDTTGYEGMSIGELISTLGSEGAAKVSELLRDKQAEKWQNYNVNYGTEGKRTSMAQGLQGAPTMPTDDTRRSDARFSANGALKPVSAPVSQREGAGGAGAGSGAGGVGAGGVAALYKATLDAQGEPTDPYKAERDETTKSRQAMAKAKLADAETSKEGLAALLGGRESRIKGREDRAEKAENLNTKMAVINAGLAMMQSTGRGLAGIAEGATKGMGMYSEGLKLTAAERQKIEDAKDSFDELKFNSENMSRKDITAARNDISEVANLSREKGIEALMKREEINRGVAEKIFDKTITVREGAANRAAQITAAGMPSGQERLFKTLGDGDVKKGFQLFTDANQEGKGTQALLQAYVKNPMLLDDLKISNPVLYKQISTMIAAQLAGPVVTQPVAGSRP